MAQYTWEEFYDKFYDWSESTQISRMSGLTDFGPSSEVFDVATEYADPKIATRFLKKAIKAGVKFTGDEIVNMIDNVTEEFIPALVMSNSVPYTRDELEYVAGYVSDDLLHRLEGARGIEYTDWKDFYEAYPSWTTEVFSERVKKLKTFGPSDEAFKVSNEFVKPNEVAAFIKQAVAAGVRFTPDEIIEISYAVEQDYVPELVKHNASPFIAEALEYLAKSLPEDEIENVIDESNIRFSQWEDFYQYYDEWDEKTQVRRAGDITDFGSAEEVSEVIQCFLDKECATAFTKLALKGGVEFPVAEIRELVCCVDSSLHRDLMRANSTKYTEDDFDYFYGLVEDKIIKYIAKEEKVPYTLPSEIQIQMPKQKGPGLFTAILAGLGMASLYDKHVNGSHHNGRCNGDCAHCPPHYGYRYGRWYYGHDHVHGCEFGGNRGSGSMD